MHFSVRWNTVLCFLLLTVEETCGQMKPSNAATKIGGTAIFNCSGTSVTPHWYLSKDGTATNQLVIAESCNVNAGFHNNYQTEKTGAAKSCNLLVFNVTMEQAGAYWCTDGIAFFALLTVTDSSPTITHNNTTDVMEGENVVITCSLNYNGSVETAPTLRPHFYWTDNTGNNASNVYNAPPTKNSVVSQLTVTAGREDIMPYTCHVYLQLMPSITAGYANNTPSVDSNASSSNITVLYAPSTPVISSIPEVIAINGVSCGISVLTCSSTGNPTPNYRWFDSAENVILSNNNNLSLAEINQTYKCEAYNTILHNSTSHTVTKEKCTANADCCVFPHNETTSVTVKGCGNGTTCDCSQAYDGIILTCYTKSFPNASYMWKGPNGEVTYSSDYNVTGNGDHRCIAYFNRTLSNYTGDIKFSNGTKETNVKECCAQWELAISFVIPYIGGNVIVLVVFLVLYFKQSGFKSLMDNRFSGTTTMTIVLLSIASVFFGLFIIPIVVTVAFCSSLKQGDVASKPGGSIQMDGIPERSGSRQENGDSSAEVSNQQGGNVANAGPGIPGWSIGVMWCVDIVLLFPTTFVAVYCGKCNQMRFEIS